MKSFWKRLVIAVLAVALWLVAVAPPQLALAAENGQSQSNVSQDLLTYRVRVFGLIKAWGWTNPSYGQGCYFYGSNGIGVVYETNIVLCRQMRPWKAVAVNFDYWRGINRLKYKSFAGFWS